MNLEPETTMESLKLYSISTQFNVLPVFGGVYDQDPILLDEWNVISEEVAKVRSAENETVTTQPSRLSPPTTKRLSPASEDNTGMGFKRTLPVRPSLARYHT